MLGCREGAHWKTPRHRDHTLLSFKFELKFEGSVTYRDSVPDFCQRNGKAHGITNTERTWFKGNQEQCESVLGFVGTLRKAVEAVTLITLLNGSPASFPHHGVRPSNPPQPEARQ